ncbi:IclR family transcriptional regulator [Paraburkholderia xenovorans]|uniref:IclR family transcriptional regulator n=1 Tax=Paraburkholderia xenovorans TaxID=36873 RepID=UPI0038BA36C8
MENEAPLIAQQENASDATVPSAARKARRGIQSIEIGFGILDVLCRADGPLPLRVIAERSGLSVANVHYYLVSFQHVGVVLQDVETGLYGLGSYALKLGVAALQQFDIYKVARPMMSQLSAQLGYTVFLGVWGNHGPTIVYRVEGGKSSPLLELRIGSVLPLLSSALGRNFLSFLPDHVTQDMVEQELAMLEDNATVKYAGEVPKSIEEVQELKQRVRQNGLSHCKDALLPHYTSLSAPVFDQAGMIVAGITVMGASSLLDPIVETDIVPSLLKCSAEISGAAGWYG